MGGKTKQSQRTKNNVRPSSSGRSAELLGARGAGSGAGSGKAALFPSLAAAAPDVGLTPEFSLCFKKLNKKDPITKTKALHEMTELVANSKAEDVAAALPSWTHFYKQLSVELDRRVREAAQTCHGAVARACGRQLAPHLRQLLPAWLQAQHDEHAPARTRAQASLSSTFPKGKLPEAISFCKVEVGAHLLDNLVGDAGRAITKKTEDPEEREQQRVRLVSGSLQGLEYFVQHLPAQHSAWLWAELEPLLQAPAFWVLAAHPAQHVRTAWYLALGRVVERFAGTFGVRHGRRAARALLAAREPGAGAGPLWSCLLRLAHADPDWHQWMDKELLVKRILDTLEKGGWGDARGVIELLLPLLASLPPEQRTRDFYQALFGASLVGLQTRSVLSSRSERQAWIESIVDCLRHLADQRDDFAVEVASAAHRAWLEAALDAQRAVPLAAGLVRASAHAMAALAGHWLQRARAQPSGVHDQLVRRFWQNLGATVHAQLQRWRTASADPAVLTHLADLHVLLLRTLAAAFMHAPRPQHAIKFHGDDGTEDAPAPAPPPEPEIPRDDVLVDRYRHDLDELLEKVCLYYLELAETEVVRDVALSPIVALLSETVTGARWAGVARDAGGLHALLSRLTGWAHARCRPALELALLAAPHLTADECRVLFESFDELPVPAVEWCVALCLSHPHSATTAARLWLRGAAAECALLAVAERVAARPDAPDTTLLLAGLAQDAGGETMLGSTAVRGVVSVFVRALRDEHNAALPHVARMSAQLASSLAGRADAALDELAAALLALTLHVPRGDPRLPTETWCEARDAWQDALHALDEHARVEVLQRARDLMHEQLFLDMSSLDVARIERAAAPSAHLLRGGSAEEAAILARLLLDFKRTGGVGGEEETRAAALRHDCVAGRMCCPFEDDDATVRRVVDEAAQPDAAELQAPALLEHVHRLLFRALCLRALLLPAPPGVVPTPDAPPPVDDTARCDALLEHPQLEEEICQLLHDHCIVCSLHEGYAFWPHFDVIERSKDRLDEVLEEVVRGTGACARRRLLAALAERAAARGYYWARARRHYELRAGQGEARSWSESELELARLRDAFTGAGYFHCVQADALEGEAREGDAKLHARYLVMVRSLHAACEDATSAERLARDACAHRAACCADVVVDAYYRDGRTMLYDAEVSGEEWRRVLASAAVADFLADLVASRGWDLPAHHWDFAAITLCSLLGSLTRSTERWACTKVALLTRATLRLLAAVRDFVHSVRAESERRSPTPHVAALPREWADVVAPDAQRNLFTLLLHVTREAAAGRGACVSCAGAQVLAALVDAARSSDWALLPETSRRGALAPGELTRAAAAALAARAHHAHKYLAHALLAAAVEPLVLEDAETLAAWSAEAAAGEERERARPSLALRYYEPALRDLHDALGDALRDVRLGEEVRAAAPGSELHVLALGYLLLADALHLAAPLQHGDLRHHYRDMFREGKYAEQLLTCALRLLPAAALQFASAPTRAAPPSLAAAFLVARPRSVLEPARADDVAALACRALFLAVSGWGCASARSWWGSAPVRSSRALQRLVCAYVAPALVREQLQRVHVRARELTDAEVTVHWAAGEVRCALLVDERRVELSVALGEDHPLSLPRIEAPAPHAPAPPAHWLAVYLAYQGGSLLSALKMWASAVSARVEAAPQCYICYCRLHPGTGRLPAALCRQCNNKFHTQCLRKWFTTSNKSNCPLCRAIF